MTCCADSRCGVTKSSGSKTWVVASRPVILLLLVAISALGQDAPPPSSFSITGVVKSGNTPIPGATVTATNSSTEARLQLPPTSTAPTRYRSPPRENISCGLRCRHLRRRTREIVLGEASSRADLELTLLSRTQQAERTQQRPATARTGRGFQSLSVMQGLAASEASNSNGADQIVPAGMPIPGVAADAATESVSFSGNNSNVGMFGMSTDELEQRMREGREQAGGFGGGGGPGGGGPGVGGPPGGGGGPGRRFRRLRRRRRTGRPMMLGGGRGRFDINRPHGSVYYSVGDSALDAAPYALNDSSSDKASYLRQRFGVALGGPLNIPGIYQGRKQDFFLCEL